MRALPILFCLVVFRFDLLAADAPPAPATNAAPAPAATNAPPAAAVPAEPSFFNFTVNSLDGKPVDLGQYRGHVVLVVNTASQGGYTGQYNGLEKLYEAYKDKGFVVLAFPCNDFGNQEPGKPEDIASLCTNRFNVTFPLFEKTKTIGDGKSTVYQYLSTGHGEPTWNFHKYLIGKDGKVIIEFSSQVGPDSKDLKQAIEAAL